jgi:PAS domain S-box-containing protein
VRALKDERVQTSIEGVYVEEERRTLALSYLITNLFEARGLDDCLDVAIKGLSMLDFFQSQISLLEDGYFVVKRNHMDKRYQFLLERMWGRKFLGHKIDARTPFMARLLNSKIVTTADIKDTVKVKLEDFIKEYASQEGSQNLGKITRVISILPKTIDLLMLPLNYQEKIIGAVGFSGSSPQHEDVLFLQNACELFAQAFERIQTREELRKSEGELRSIFASSPDAIAVTDLNGNIADCNQATLDIGGYSSKDEVIGKNALWFFAEKDRERAILNLKKTLEQDLMKNVEYTFLAKDGREYPVELSASVLKDSSGNSTGFVAITRDITERKQAEQAIRESQEKFERLFMNNPEAAVYADQDSHILDVNPSFTKLFSFSLSEVKGKLLEDLIVPKSMAVDADVFTKKVKKGQVYYDTVRRRKDGSLVPVSISAAPITVEDKLIGAVILYKDITKRKQMEEKLRQYSENLEELVQKRTQGLLESEKRYSVLVEEASDGVLMIQDGKIVFANKRVREIVGYSKDELIGVPFEEIIDEKHRQSVNKRCMRKLRGEDILTLHELELIAKTGERVPVEVSCARVNYQNRPAILEMLRDISERKRIEEQRSKLKRLETMGELATMIAHDLRNPLTSIRNAGYYIKNVCPHRADAECKTILEMLDIIERETVFANNIVNDLLDFAVKKPLQKRRQDINQLIDASLKASDIPENVKVKRTFAKRAAAAVDEKQLKRGFLNLIRNAVQAMPKGGKLTIKTGETKDHVEIAFRDTGVGIPEENTSRIFTPLFTTKAKGIGMGLAICKRVVEQHGGIIDVKSKIGKGTTFTMKLPKKEGNKQ